MNARKRRTFTLLACITAAVVAAGGRLAGEGVEKPNWAGCSTVLCPERTSAHVS